MYTSIMQWGGEILNQPVRLKNRGKGSFPGKNSLPDPFSGQKYGERLTQSPTLDYNFNHTYGRHRSF